MLSHGYGRKSEVTNAALSLKCGRNLEDTPIGALSLQVCSITAPALNAVATDSRGGDAFAIYVVSTLEKRCEFATTA